MKFTAVSFRRTTPECLYSHRVFHPLWNVRRRIFTHFVAPRDLNFLHLAKKHFKFSFDLHFFGSQTKQKKIRNQFSRWSFSFVIVIQPTHSYTTASRAHLCWCTDDSTGKKRRKTVKSIQKIMLNIPSSVACHVSVSSNVFTALRVNFTRTFLF